MTAEQETDAPAALTEQRGNVLLITLNRPEARNAVNAAVRTEVGDALHQAQHDPAIRAVVITGDEVGWSRTMREMGGVLRSKDAKEGPLAFAQKRQPVWKAK